jgi:hypothetical protein
MIPRARPGARPAVRLALAALVTTAALAAGAAPALADGASISVTTVDGRSDPVAFIPRIFTVSGTAPAGSLLFVKHRAAGGAPCAPTAYSDPGSNWTGFYGLAVSGAFNIQKVVTWDAVGTWTFCFWLAPSERTIASAIAQAVTFRLPTGTMTGSAQPSVPRPGRSVTVTVTGVSEAPRTLYAKVRSALGAPCAQTYDADAGESLISGETVDGAFTGRANTVEPTPGQYVVCVWLAGTADDPMPVAMQTLSFNVQAIPPVLSSAVALDCSTRRVLHRFRSTSVRAVCMRYRFSTSPYAGQRLLVSYVTPAHRIYKTVASRWPTGGARVGITPSLPARAYRHRRGTWHAILRIAGHQIKSTSFRVT